MRNFFASALVILFVLNLGLKVDAKSPQELTPRKEDEVVQLRHEIKQLQMHADEQERAIAKCNEALKVFPKMGVFYLDRSNSRLVLKQYARALSDLKKAKSLDSNLIAECAFAEAVILKNQNKKHLALSVFNSIPREKPWQINHANAIARICLLLDLDQLDQAQKEYLDYHDVCRIKKNIWLEAALKKAFPEFGNLPLKPLEPPEKFAPKVVRALEVLTECEKFPTIASIEDATGITLVRMTPSFQGDEYLVGARDYLYIRVDKKNSRLTLFVNGYECAVSRRALLDAHLIVGDPNGLIYNKSADTLHCSYQCNGVFNSLKECTMTWFPPFDPMRKSK
jgi:tetratricopeptide (TPR) repeat protein